MDFFSARSFRRTLLVKAAQAAKIKRTLLPERAQGLHVSGRFTCTQKSSSTWMFSNDRGASLSAGSEVVCRALEKLSAAFPATRTVRELAAEVRAGSQEGAILDAVFKAALMGLAEISTVPLRVSKASRTKPKPRAGRLPRLDAEQGNTWTTDPTHDVLPLDPVCATLLPFLDGAHDRDALREKLLAALHGGRLRLTDNATGLEPTGPALDKAIGLHVANAIDRLAAAGVLE